MNVFLLSSNHIHLLMSISRHYFRPRKVPNITQNFVTWWQRKKELNTISTIEKLSDKLNLQGRCPWRVMTMWFKREKFHLMKIMMTLTGQCFHGVAVLCQNFRQMDIHKNWLLRKTKLQREKQHIMVFRLKWTVKQTSTTL